MDGKNAVNPEISDRGNETIVQQGKEGSSRRTIEKGEFRDNIEHNFHDATKAWRKQINYLQSQLVNNIDISTLQNESRTLEQCMDNLTQAHDALEMVSESTVEKIILYGKFEDMSRENNNVLKQVHQTIRDLKADLNDRGSVTSKRTNRSGSSRKTGRSLGSRYSRGSTNSSTRQRRQELEEEVAILKAKMRLVHEKEELDKANQQALEEIEERVLEIQREEKRVKEQIKISEEKFKMREDLAETEARIEVCTKFDCDDGHLTIIDELHSDDGSQQHMQRFLESQPDLPSTMVRDLENGTTPNPWTLQNSPPVEITTERQPSTTSSPRTPELPATKHSTQAPEVPTTNLNPNTPDFIPATRSSESNAVENCPADHSMSNDSKASVNPTTDSESTTMLQTITKLLETQNQNRLPLPAPGIFNGDPLKYPIWLRAFETLVESRAVNPAERLHFLGKYVAGEAKEVIEGFMLLDGEDAYQRAKEMLGKRYGDPFAVACAFRKKLEAWPVIAPYDSSGLRKYSDFLVQCEKAMHKVDSLKVLNDDQENQRMASKLPKWALTRWSRIVYKWKEDNKKFPPFSEFVNYLVREADIACDPINNRQPRKEDGGSKPPFGKPRRAFDKGRSLRTHSDDKNDGENKPMTKVCTLCNGTHELDSCKKFLEMDMKARKEFAKTKGLCFGCLGRGHLSKECKKRKKCVTCGKGHPTSLHGDYKVNTDDVKQTGTQTVLCTKTCSTNDECQARISSMIVPVWLHHTENPENEILVYALLDDQSDTTFISLNVLNNLDVNGHETLLSLSTMHADSKLIQSHKINGLVINDFNRSNEIQLPRTFSCASIPVKRDQIPRPEMASKWQHLAKIAPELVPYHLDVEVGLLIGANCPRAITPRQVIPGRDNEPYAQLTDLGWGIIGNVNEPCAEDGDLTAITHRVTTHIPAMTEESERSCTFAVKRVLKEVINPQQLRQMMESDFSERNNKEQPISLDDRKFLDQLEKGIHQRKNGHYEMPLPFREKLPTLPNNKPQALRRLERLKTRLERDERYRQHYNTFMKELIDKGYAERVPDNECSEETKTVWYIPHHGVYHPQKPEKLRVVFDCSASFHDESLNSHLLQGPDLTNGLVGVLCRFRQGPVAFSCDVEGMFHQFHVDEAHRNYLRFLWWENEDYASTPTEFRMTVHLFGATSSPGCANYGLRKIADDNADEFGLEVANFVKKDFYVDDGLKSVTTVPEAVSLIHNTKDLLARGGLRLHKFVSNSKDVLATIAPEDRATGLKDLNFPDDRLPVERTLGTHWCIESDSFQLRITLQDKPFTRRGILSTVSSIYDPLGFVAPLLLKGKQILQDLCREKADWDDPVPEQIKRKWEKWRNDLLLLNDMKVQRCLVPVGFEEAKTTELHHFSDASTTGYGQCSYLRLVNDKDEVHCAFVMGKSRVTPLKPITIPRLELSAALVSVKVSCMLHDELDYDNIVDVFWTDSKVALGYITNDARRFQVFVANRVQQIRDCTSPDQWNYVETKENPADDASRGLSSQQLNETSRWLTGPAFLWQPDFRPVEQESWNPAPDDPEVKKANSFVTQTSNAEFPSMVSRIDYFSCWFRAKRAVANCLKLKNRLKNHPKKRNLNITTGRHNQPSVEDFQRAETAILKMVQEEAFPEEMKILRQVDVSNRKGESKLKASLKGASCLYRLDPFLDPDGVLRVGGRIKRSSLPYHIKHPAVLPRKGHVTTLIIRYYHQNIKHQGRGMTLNELRSNGFWIIGGSSAVGYHIANCVTCQKLRGAVQEQKMADLPSDRLEPAPPFTFCAVDYFGPWYIKEGRRELKRYGVLFTCLASRAIHLEVAKTLETDSFINVLRCFLARRGPVRQLRSDQGTNLVGARGELKEALRKMDPDEVRRFLLKKECDFFEFKLNTPKASHAGGVWERMIRTVRNALDGLLEQHGTQLDEESLRTLICEAEAIVNSRPIVAVGTNSPEVEPLTPNHLLTMKSRVLMAPPGEFQRADVFLVKR
jgi:hypothetical protein